SSTAARSSTSSDNSESGSTRSTAPRRPDARGSPSTCRSLTVSTRTAILTLVHLTARAHPLQCSDDAAMTPDRTIDGTCGFSLKDVYATIAFRPTCPELLL